MFVYQNLVNEKLIKYFGNNVSSFHMNNKFRNEISWWDGNDTHYNVRGEIIPLRIMNNYFYKWDSLI